jgi:hypothetical protein
MPGLQLQNIFQQAVSYFTSLHTDVIKALPSRDPYSGAKLQWIIRLGLHVLFITLGDSDLSLSQTKGKRLEHTFCLRTNSTYNVGMADRESLSYYWTSERSC